RALDEQAGALYHLAAHRPEEGRLRVGQRAAIQGAELKHPGRLRGGLLYPTALTRGGMGSLKHPGPRGVCQLLLRDAALARRSGVEDPQDTALVQHGDAVAGLLDDALEQPPLGVEPGEEL